MLIPVATCKLAGKFNLNVISSTHNGNYDGRNRRDLSHNSDHIARPLPELEVRTGAGQSFVESGLQGHTDKRGDERERSRNENHQSMILQTVFDLLLHEFPFGYTNLY